MIGGQGEFQTKMNLSPSLSEIESKTILEIPTPDKTQITTNKIVVIIPCYNED